MYIGFVKLSIDNESPYGVKLEWSTVNPGRCLTKRISVKF